MGTPHTIHEALQEFLVDRESLGRAPDTIRFYRTHLTRFADYLNDLGTRSLGDLSRQGLRGFFAYLHRRDVTQNTRAAYDRAIRAFLHWCRCEYEFQRDLFEGRPRIKQSQELPETWTDDDLRALLGTCENDDIGIRDRAIMLLFLDTGLRAGELAGLDLEDLSLDDDQGMVRVRPEHSKSRHERQVPVSPETVRRLRQWLKVRPSEAVPLFVACNGVNLGTDPLTPSGLNQLIRRHVESAGIRAKHALCHIWRHTFAKRYVVAGGDIETLRRMLGHTSLDVTRRYLNFKTADLREKHRQFSPVNRLLGTATAD